jgi:hypothetical protein
MEWKIIVRKAGSDINIYKTHQGKGSRWDIIVTPLVTDGVWDIHPQ